MKQETVEEVALKLYPIIKTNDYMDMYDKNFDIRNSFIRGYEKASEELFTKDDLITFYEFIKKECDTVNTSGYAEIHVKWFIEKFKNK